MGAFEDVRAALDAAPGDEALNRAARELAAEATRGARARRGGRFRSQIGSARSSPRRTARWASRDADARSIRRAYRRAAATWHPDKWTTRSRRSGARRRRRSAASPART